MEKIMKKTKVNHDWIRVYGPDLDPDRLEREKANKNIYESEDFQELCKKANIDPNKRQASKYRRKRGLVYKVSKGLVV